MCGSDRDMVVACIPSFARYRRGPLHVVPYTVAADLFRSPQLTSISGLLGIAWGLAPVVAPAVGGLLVQSLATGMIAAVLLAISLPPDNNACRTPEFKLLPWLGLFR